VTLIALDDGTQLSGLQRIVENDANSETAADPSSPEPTGGDEPPAEENS
jgi:DNA gyrase subunit A